MGTPVVILPSGGIAVTESPNGIPLTEATNGRGFAVTFVASGGLPVIGITSGPDVTAPIITSSNAISQPENAILNHVLSANETVTWAKVGGADTAKFTLVGNTLTLPAKDFENPDDAGLNNTYIVQVQATDTASNVSLVQTITVTITDVFEVGPTAPVLAMDPAWTTTDSTPDFTIDIDDTIGAGDSIQLQIQAAGGDWSSPIEDVTHVITAPEDAANEIALALGSQSNANYEARARVSDGTPSAWSNVVSFTIAAVASGHGLLWGTDAIVWGADYMTWETPAPPVITFGSSVDNTTAGTSFTVAGVGIGAADPSRYVVVAVAVRSSSALTTPTVTVNGSAATLIKGMITGTGAASFSGLFQVPAIMASGTTATVVISGFGASAVRCAVQGYSVVTATAAIPSGTAVSDLTAVTTTMTGSITVPTNGRAIVAMCVGVNNVPCTVPAPASGVTIDKDAVIGASVTQTFSAHDTINRTGATTYTISTAGTTVGATPSVAAVVAAWR